ncbi:MAG: hypothetical protein ACI8QZ_000382 [Chlamydiales bacterium]|jgi:hypothetical protein
MVFSHGSLPNAYTGQRPIGPGLLLPPGSRWIRTTQEDSRSSAGRWLLPFYLQDGVSLMNARLFSQFVAVTLCATIANAQGSDDCATAQSIVGLGVFPFDNNTATPDGPADCNGQTVRKDVWFDWIAPSTGDFKVKTCNLTTLDTRVAVYDGVTCPPTLLLVCAHGGCINQTIVDFPAVNGQHYLIRVGSRMVGDGGSGSFRIVENPCGLIPDDAFEDNDDCASAIPMVDGSYPGLYVDKTDPDWWSFDLDPGANLNVDILFTHATGDIDVYLYAECGSTILVTGGTGSDNENVNFTNAGASCQTYRLKVEHWFPDTASDCQNYTMDVTGTGVCAPTCVSFCSALPNATGSGAVLTCAGNPTTSLVLTSTPVPNTTGQFFYGPMMLAGNPFGDGLLCSGGALTRMLPFISAGMMMQLPNTATFTMNYSAPYASGLTGTKHFQHWFRSGLGTGAGYNTSDGLSITF